MFCLFDLILSFQAHVQGHHLVVTWLQGKIIGKTDKLSALSGYTYREAVQRALSDTPLDYPVLSEAPL